MKDDLIEKLFNIDFDFEKLALEIFNYQYQHCTIYKKYVDAIGKNPNQIKSVLDIPFLPISFFKTHKVVCGNFTEEIIFKSSGTTSSTTAKHFLKSISIYQKSFTNTFQKFYGSAQNTCILALLPSYIENGDSSLVFMVDDLIKNSNQKDSGIYLYDFEKLAEILKYNFSKNIPTILIGVTYALLQFAEKYPMQLNENLIIMETGGMKGRGEEKTRMEVHQILKNAFGLQQIHSEYGMTELLSQAYSKQDGIFKTASSLKVLIRDLNDPLQTDFIGKGALNIIDLANIYSCSFIATQDIGEVFLDGSFLVNGRIDNSDIRGCNMLV